MEPVPSTGKPSSPGTRPTLAFLSPSVCEELRACVCVCVRRAWPWNVMEQTGEGLDHLFFLFVFVYFKL